MKQVDVIPTIILVGTLGAVRQQTVNFIKDYSELLKYSGVA